MHVRTILAAGIIAAAVFATAGGGGAAAGSGVALGGGAVAAPADTAAFVAIDSDLASAQWQTLDSLLAKLPQSDSLVTKLQQSLEQKSGLSWSTDVRPALGPELDVAVLPTVSGGKPQVVVLTQPASQTALGNLLQKLAGAGGPAPVSEQVGAWTAISDSQSALSAVSGATATLAGDTLYQEASGKLAADALVSAYANGTEARQLVAALGGSAGAGNLVWAAADVVASDGGLTVDGFVRSDQATPQPYASSLVHQIPGGALLVADFQAGEASASTPPPSSPLGAALATLRGTLGGETAVYVSPGAPLPAVTLVTHPSDPAATLGALKDALGALGSAFGGATTGGFDLGSLLGALQLSHAQLGSTLVVSTSQQAIDAFTGSGSKLADDATFQEALAASGMPAETTGFVYVNLAGALPAIQGLLTLAGGSSPLGGVDLGALRTLTAYGSGASGGVSGFTAFLEVR
jgi:Protein of unknown function (DUF3352)